MRPRGRPEGVVVHVRPGEAPGGGDSLHFLRPRPDVKPGLKLAPRPGVAARARSRCGSPDGGLQVYIIIYIYISIDVTSTSVYITSTSVYITSTSVYVTRR